MRANFRSIARDLDVKLAGQLTWPVLSIVRTKKRSVSLGIARWRFGSLYTIWRLPAAKLSLVASSPRR
eukprot:5144190-Pleurochrysis_carterae.AAC.1